MMSVLYISIIADMYSRVKIRQSAPVQFVSAVKHIDHRVVPSLSVSNLSEKVTLKMFS